MNLQRIMLAAAEIALDTVFAIAIMVMVSGHRWLDVTLWVIALAGLVGAIWLASRRRRLGRIE